MDETGRSLRVLLWPANPALAVRLGLERDIEVVSSPMGRPAVALVESVDGVREVREEAPECAVLVLVGSARSGLREAALAAGAAGLVLRDGPLADLAASLHRASRGEPVTDPALDVP
ncbi:DNA-binding response regulator [Streptomyces sp. NPDC046557]|uniref:DNA-binding response regulator n=1 Tax=unclassified Streptomyces TaxID=2593676 RepID=UPI00340BE5F3